MADGVQRGDIEDREDVERLVRAFYGRALVDPVIGWIFVDVAHLDLEEHLPKIASFWETILLGHRTYAGGAFRPHAALHAQVPLRAGHFERWLALWRATVDELFAGERAELAKAHAARVARAFRGRLEGMGPTPAGGDGGGLAVTRHGPDAPGPAPGGALRVVRHGAVGGDGTGA
jgi:hemoglobin